MQRQGIYKVFYCFGIMAAALSWVACSQTEDMTPETDELIGFGVAMSADSHKLAAKQGNTRAIIAGNEFPKNHFNVWGGYEGNTVFDKRTVYWSEEQGWTYDGLEKWVYNTYHFYAVYPATVNATYVAGEKTLTIADYDVNNHPEDDFLIAEVAAHNFPNDGGIVRLNFKHALAAVRFAFKLDGEFTYTNTYKVTNIKWGNVYTQGLFAANGTGTINATATGVPGETNAITAFTGTTFTATSAMESDYQLVIPQERADATLLFTIDVNGESKEIVKTIPIDWEVGKRYTYNVTFDPFEITIETTPWEIPEVGDIIVQ